MIRSIQYISCTDEPLVFTASLDRYVKLFSLDGEERGVLKQGYMLKPDEYNWQFPLSDFDSKKDSRQENIKESLRKEFTSPANEKRRERVRQNEIALS